MLRISTACFACCLAGCMATDAVYPVTWASRVKLESQQCPDIDGEYRNLGDLSKESDIGTYTVEPASISLAHILAGRAENEERLNFTQGDATTDAHRSVHLSVADDTLQVIVKRTDGTVRTLQMPVERECSASMIDAGAAWDGTTTLLASEVDRSSMKLGRSEDGALLMRTNQSIGYFITYIPIFGTKDQRWIRFPLFTPEAESPESVAATESATVTASAADVL